MIIISIVGVVMLAFAALGWFVVHGGANLNRVNRNDNHHDGGYE